MRLELEMLGYIVLTAPDGATGLRIAREKRPDVIISDLKMPGIDGYELIKAIRAVPELANTPAIAMTGLAIPSEIPKLRSAGFDAWLTKPAGADDIFALVQQLSRPSR
jgi:CheY-like chemotaxis protein